VRYYVQIGLVDKPHGKHVPPDIVLIILSNCCLLKSGPLPEYRLTGFVNSYMAKIHPFRQNHTPLAA
jgi:hypothetical protein